MSVRPDPVDGAAPAQRTPRGLASGRRLDAVLRARATPTPSPTRALARADADAAGATGCGYSAQLGTRAPCGVVMASKVGDVVEMTVVSSKSSGALGLGDSWIAPSEPNEQQRALQTLMNDEMYGPHYGNVYACSGTTASFGTYGEGDATMQMSMGQLQAMDAAPVVGDRVTPGIEEAWSGVSGGMFKAMPKGTEWTAIPFNTGYGSRFGDAVPV